MDDSYTCTLDEVTEKKAIKELNEIPSDRLKAVQSLREWLHSQEHIRFFDDTKTLLSFLRGAKFSQLRAREMITGYLMMKNKAPHWFKDIDSRDPKLLDIMRRGYVLPLPKRDPNGCQIVLYRLGSLDASTKVVSVTDEIHADMIIGHYLSREEITQVNGSVFIADFTGITAKHMTRWTVDDIRKWSKLWQNNVPGRFKAFHYYNAGSFMDALLALIKPFLKKKFQERMHIHQTLESLYKYVPMEYLPVDYLPDDYKGPHQGKVEDLIDAFIDNITTDEFRDGLLRITSEAVGVDESKLPKKTEPEAHYRKLEVE